MKTELRKVYRCEFCKKTGLSAGAMSRHEKYCYLRPENKHKCFDYCIHLRKWNETRERYYGDESIPFTVTHFDCDALKIGLYSYKLEKKLNFQPDFIKGLTKMPTTCDSFKTEYDHDNEEYFDL